MMPNKKKLFLYVLGSWLMTIICLVLTFVTDTPIFIVTTMIWCMAASVGTLVLATTEEPWDSTS